MRDFLRMALFATSCTAVACGSSAAGPMGDLDASPGDGTAADQVIGTDDAAPGDDGGNDASGPDDSGSISVDSGHDAARSNDAGQDAGDPARINDASQDAGDAARINDASQDAGDSGHDAANVDDAGQGAGDGGHDAGHLNDAAASTIDGGVCGALSAGPLPDGGDVTYSWASSAKAGCLSAPFCQVACDANLLAGLLACDAVQGGYYWSLGSIYIRVAGRQGGTCAYEIGVETEGSVTYSRCTTPLPAKPWHGLFYLNAPGSSAAPDILNGLDSCQVVSTCNLISGAPNQCDQTTAGPPTCPTNNVYGPC
jgi:hypothetical protein